MRHQCLGRGRYGFHRPGVGDARVAGGVPELCIFSIFIQGRVQVPGDLIGPLWLICVAIAVGAGRGKRAQKIKRCWVR